MTASPTSTARPGRLRTWLLVGTLVVAGVGGVFAWQVARPESSDAPPVPPVVEPDPEITGPPWFRDMTATSGVAFTYRNGEEAGQFAILESLGGGVALFDYDRDGRLDLFVTGGGHFDGPDRKQLRGYPCKLYRNRSGWKFDDVTTATGLEREWWYTHGVAVADYDRDGWPDLLVTGFGKVALFRNEPDGAGGRRFVDVSDTLKLRDDSWATSAGWGDLDGDGFPDLYVCHYCDWSPTNNPACSGLSLTARRDICPPVRFRPLVHALFHNDRGRGFQNRAADQGVTDSRCGLGVVLADVNDDARPDIYVGNDTNNNFLFLNRGGKLVEVGLAAGVATDEAGHPNGSMGVDVGDYDRSGRASIWVTNFQGELHALYRNRGNEAFQHQSQLAGIGAIGKRFVGFGTAFVDVDADGWEDLVIANGHVYYTLPAADRFQRPVLLRNVQLQGRRMFRDESRRGGPFFQVGTLGRGLAVGDLDNDGRPDLVFCHTNSPVALLRNEAAADPANAGHGWLGIQLVGQQNRDVVGSTVIVETDAGRLTRFVKGGGSYLSASAPRLLFGLGTAGTVSGVTVKWSWGQVQRWENLTPNAYWQLREGDPTPQRLPPPPGP